MPRSLSSTTIAYVLLKDTPVERSIPFANVVENRKHGVQLKKTKLYPSRRSSHASQSTKAVRLTLQLPLSPIFIYDLTLGDIYSSDCLIHTLHLMKIRLRTRSNCIRRFSQRSFK
ncbi:hypothetical protein M378DRAFT_204538 [Amanita muscaria Koide BX008]|uniref:Uncharacterized protein n=1 Tax=Amanita muscaria (strain Koide BX008) TaxID=946122 RepID=A0A0C2X9X7_AMAMK|nr:hypothetical protein M378DRAFT_204538 [Amanita muscaria Koide BX008]